MTFHMQHRCSVPTIRIFKSSYLLSLSPLKGHEYHTHSFAGCDSFNYSMNGRKVEWYKGKQNIRKDTDVYKW